MVNQLTVRKQKPNPGYIEITLVGRMEVSGEEHCALCFPWGSDDSIKSPEFILEEQVNADAKQNNPHTILCITQSSQQDSLVRL